MAKRKRTSLKDALPLAQEGQAAPVSREERTKRVVWNCTEDDHCELKKTAAGLRMSIQAVLDSIIRPWLEKHKSTK